MSETPTTHTPEQYKQPTLSENVLRRLGGDALGVVADLDPNHMRMTTEARKAADEIAVEEVANPGIIDRVPGAPDRTEAAPTPDTHTYRREVTELPKDYKPSDPTRIPNHPSNPATQYIQSFVEHSRKTT